MQSIMREYQKMSRPMQWATLAAIGLLLFVAWDQFIVPQTEHLDKQADAIASQVRDLRSIETESLNLRDRRKHVVWTIGPVRPPVPIAEGAAMVDEVIHEVLKKHGAINPTYSSRSRSKLPRNALFGFTEGRKRIDRYTADVKFDATPEKAAAIIAEIESNPHIEAITNLRIVRDTGGKVRVTMLIESWLVSSESGQGELA